MFGIEPGSRSDLALFIDECASATGRTYLKIALAAGYSSANIIQAFIADQAKVPLDRVADLAHALECDASKLLELTLERHFNPETFIRMRSLFIKDITDNERAWLAALQEASGEPDPVLTQERAARLKKVF